MDQGAKASIDDLIKGQVERDKALFLLTQMPTKLKTFDLGLVSYHK